ncbi:TetR/AcrR family transcriptional regulator [Stenotrophomonas sp. S48]|uniref:TetR/AcrR family transcriptional regulator n=1 Tax=unclassified Stenotrophomonas TaxID=196198 RepID=UPI00190245C1|nr:MULTISPECIES: TetR/AcrR family transcriptional regulator [unclassified Stenotrophomonas]MBK0025113.1 TetR/AcrR family transcriptional regulator [Stenotrophomonas sp. S48]MBK0048112.1 TetR/AcrR family transcriptional regulator [Stenotrophomonas sp. S49]
MSPRASDAPQRVIDAAAQMLARVGLNATSIREVTKLADAPLGSTYHHFPGGKQELLAKATTMAGDRVEALLLELLRDGAVPGLERFLAMWRERLLRSQFRAGCPVLAAAVEEPVEAVSSQPRAAAAEVFARWQGHLAQAFVGDGHAPEQAAGLASLVIASVEGAVAMSRALQDIAPFDQVTEHLLKAARAG